MKMKLPNNSYKSALALAYALHASFSVSLAIHPRGNSAIQVNYKETHICETTPGVKSYAGYVTLPPDLDPTVAPYTNNMFFWFFEAQDRPETAPLTIWLQGGPASPSIDQALSLNGPCIVGEDSNSTSPNPWNWNKHANLLYIDQPAQTGFTYDEVVDGVLNALDGSIDTSTKDPSFNITTIKGKFSSQDPAKTVNSTEISARAIYHFMQGWFDEFETYRRDKINLWGQSYAGHFVPAIADLFIREQNEETSELSKLDSSKYDIGIDAIGIFGGFIDMITQFETHADWTINNSYGIKAVDDETYKAMREVWEAPDGCRAQMVTCRQLLDESDPHHFYNNETIEKSCGAAFELCWTKYYLPYETVSGRDYFDIASPRINGYLPPFAYGYLTNEWVQKELGVKVNYSQSSNAPNSFITAGDFIPSYKEALGRILDSGVNVALSHGDRDVRCNWVGGEAVSLAIPHDNSEAFAAAGYADLVTNDTYVGGKVRQHGSLSFSRVFQAGHEVGIYQPETAYQIFERTVFKKDLATGQKSLFDDNDDEAADYSTEGPAGIFDIRQMPPEHPKPAQCYLGYFPLSSTCSSGQVEALINGTAIVKNRIVVEPAAEKAEICC